MATMKGLSGADEAAIEAIRSQLGDDAATQFAAEVYKLRVGQNAPHWSGIPRWVLVLSALWLAVLETADKLPQVLLAFPRYEATLAETQAKLMQPDLVAAQLAKAKNDAAASVYQTRLASAQAEKTEHEAKAASYMPDTSRYQMQRAGLDAVTATFQPQTAQTQLTKLQIDTKKAGFELPQQAAAAIQAEQNAAMANSMMKIIGPMFGSFAGSDSGKVNSIVNPSARLNELQGSMNAGQTSMGAGANAPSNPDAPQPKPASRRRSPHRPSASNAPPGAPPIASMDPPPMGSLTPPPLGSLPHY